MHVARNISLRVPTGRFCFALDCKTSRVGKRWRDSEVVHAKTFFLNFSYFIKYARVKSVCVCEVVKGRVDVIKVHLIVSLQ